jgi:hypothetical protein
MVNMLRQMQNAMNFAALAGLTVALAGCPRNVQQDANSGKDAQVKGAKPVTLEGGEGRVRDIVTYPGGDRVDWKLITLPEGQQGDLNVKLRWQAPRPGLDLAFDVYDQWFERVAQAKPSAKAGSSKNVTIKRASGKYYVQVYAPRRQDAGRYTLSVRFKERKPVVLPTMEELAGQISDPPVLPAIVEPKERTPEEIAAEEAERARLAEEQRLVDEERSADAERLAELRKPVYARVRQTQKASGGGVIITINAGKNMNVDNTWTGTLLRGNSNQPLPDGSFKIIRVTARESVAKVQLTMDQVKANPRVELRRGM